MKLIDVAFVSEAAAFADGDVLTDVVEIPNAADSPNQAVVLDSITLVDADDQGIALDIFILRANNSLGTKNAAPDATDADCLDIVAIVSVDAAFWIDMGGAKVADLDNLQRLVKPLTGTSLYAQLVTRGAPTHTAAGLKGKFGFRCK